MHSESVLPQRSSRVRGIWWFLVLAFVPAWAAWIGVGVVGGSMDDPATQLATAAFGPALAAIVVRAWITREGFADAGMAPRLRQSWRTYLVALALPPGMLGVCLLLAWAAGYWDPAATVWADHALFLLLIPVIPIVAMPIFWGEEFGWTAYLRDRLLPGRPVATTFATGFIWGVWHWPLPWVGYFGAGVEFWDAFVGMLLWIPLSVLLEFLIGFVWGQSRSVWPATIVHGGGNLVVSFGLDDLTGASMSVTVSTLVYCVAMVPFVIAAIVWTVRRRAQPLAPAGPDPSAGPLAAPTSARPGPPAYTARTSHQRDRVTPPPPAEHTYPVGKWPTR
ncbi:CPBP family intramembrane glutamic endopeptidase [Nocardia puris]|uniref:CAAX prenyl protease-like protein n=1 Tax=Nocardia puris TaxID=208602 RepID=A0A366E1G8_9NOCA|nr:CPBP family intramembrane glutamic endopeptidase [Nocardia puris]RBO96216.1 CAAX prenyl protease-like protein [Nocardia puris]